MAFDTAETTTTIEIPCDALHAMLAGVAPVASRDATRAYLQQVQIRWDAYRVTVTATDGHRLHRTTLGRPDGSTGTGAVYLTREAATALAKAAKAATKATMPPPATVGPTEIRYPGGAVACSSRDPGFPPCDKVIPLYDGPGAHRVGLDPQYLADACKILPGVDGVEIRLGADDMDPIRVDAYDLDTGVRGVAVVMPRRI